MPNYLMGISEEVCQYICPGVLYMDENDVDANNRNDNAALLHYTVPELPLAKSTKNWAGAHAKYSR